MSRLRSGHRLVGPIGSEVRDSAGFQKVPRLAGRLGSDATSWAG